LSSLWLSLLFLLLRLLLLLSLLLFLLLLSLFPPLSLLLLPLLPLLLLLLLLLLLSLSHKCVLRLGYELAFVWCFWCAFRSGNAPCTDVKRVSPRQLSCTMAPATVGRYLVSVELGGSVSREAVVLDRMCGAGYFGVLGRSCQACPAEAVCYEFLPFPVPAEGYYEEAAQKYVNCVPTEACPARDMSALLSTVGADKLSLTAYLAAVAASSGGSSGGNSSAGGEGTGTGAETLSSGAQSLVEYSFGGSSVSFLMDIAAQNDILLQYYNTSLIETLPSVCATGYTGPKCSQCMAEHYRLESTCVACPKAAYGLIIGYFGGLIVLLALVFYGKRKKVGWRIDLIRLFP
jgi:hypothetical protein